MNETFPHIVNSAVFWYSDGVVLLEPSCIKHGKKYDFHEVSYVCAIYFI